MLEGGGLGVRSRVADAAGRQLERDQRRPVPRSHGRQSIWRYRNIFIPPGMIPGTMLEDSVFV